jgi:hypothetical protein
MALVLNQYCSQTPLKIFFRQHRSTTAVMTVLALRLYDAVEDGGSMSITSAQSYEMRISRSSDKITDPPEPYWQTVERLLADRGVDHVARLLAYALDKAQGKA